MNFKRDLLTYSDGANNPGELCYNDFTQTVDLTWMSDCEAHGLAFLRLFLSRFSP